MSRLVDILIDYPSKLGRQVKGNKKKIKTMKG